MPIMVVRLCRCRSVSYWARYSLWPRRPPSRRLSSTQEASEATSPNPRLTPWVLRANERQEILVLTYERWVLPDPPEDGRGGLRHRWGQCGARCICVSDQSPGGRRHDVSHLHYTDHSQNVRTLGCSLFNKFGLNFMAIQSWSWFTELGRYLQRKVVQGIEKRSPRSEIFRVKRGHNNIYFFFYIFFLFFFIHLHNLLNYAIFSYLESKFPSRNMCTE